MKPESPSAQRKRVARADLRFDTAVAHSEEGLPVGNGRMGSLVWTTPSSLKLQINRPDVYASSGETKSFPLADTDYAYACGFVDVDFVDVGADVFPDQGTNQHLSVFEGLATIEGRGIQTQVHTWTEHDVMAIKVSDSRSKAQTIAVNLRKLRFNPQFLLHLDPDNTIPLYTGFFVDKTRSEVQTLHHTASSELQTHGKRIVLKQEFSEGDFYCASAVAIEIVGRHSQARIANETSLRLAAPAGKGSFTILISSAATFDRKHDVVATSLAELDAAARIGFSGILKSSRSWWRDFWGRSHLSCHSADGVADALEQGYTFFLYLMAASSRGKLPPNFGGMIWSTAGDPREWGAQHWWHNMSCYYRSLAQANCVDLMQPMFNMYIGMSAKGARAAKDVWGSEGLFIQESSWFDGPSLIPPEIAPEMRRLYLCRKPWAKRSKTFREFVEHKQSYPGIWNWKTHEGKWVDGRWSWSDKGHGPFGHTTHIFSSTAKIAYLAWLTYEHTLDKKWLRKQAYPLIKGAAEFYRTFPNVRRGRDGKLHIHHVNNHEAEWNKTDTIEEITAMHGILPVAIRAAEMLGLDAELRPLWRDFLAALTAIPTKRHARGKIGYTAMNPVVFFDLVTLECEDHQKLDLAQNAFFPEGVPPGEGETQFHHNGIAAARLGRADALKTLVPNQMLRDSRGVIMRNRLSLCEGFQAISAQRFGRSSEAMQLALCQSVPPVPGGDPVIRLFAAWPADWDADFSLLCRGGFQVASSLKKGRIGQVEIESRCGATCRLRNPWGETSSVTLTSSHAKPKTLRGSLLSFKTRIGETLTIRKSS